MYFGVQRRAEKKLGEEKTEGLRLDEIARKRVSKVKKLTFMIFNTLWYSMYVYIMKGEVTKLKLLRYIIIHICKYALLYSFYRVFHLEFGSHDPMVPNGKPCKTVKQHTYICVSKKRQFLVTSPLIT